MSVFMLSVAVLFGVVAGTMHYVDVAPNSLTARMAMQPSANTAVTIDYQRTFFTIGWDVMNLTSNPQRSDEAQAYAAGFGEGALTVDGIYSLYLDTYGILPNGTRAKNNGIPPQIEQYFEQNIAWMDKMTAAHNATDPYWYQAGLVWLQAKGMLDGYNSVAGAGNFTMPMLLMLIGTGDYYDLLPALVPKGPGEKAWHEMSKPEYENWFARRTRCSALIKLAYDLSDIYFGHATWSTFNSMIRIYKHVTLNFRAKGTMAKTMSFSSYPGAISSIDDYYVLDTGLAVIETSFGVMNLTMYKGNVLPSSLMYWVRVTVANRMATTGPQWVETFSRYNSGTYNNQWMVLDMKLFTPGQDLKPNTLWIAEQFPGVIGSSDQTKTLQYGYWPSYNVPSNRSLFWSSGYGAAVQQQGTEMNDYQLCVRAQIFRRDQVNVKSLSDFQYMMQYNQFETDPISKGNPLYAIASRVDLANPGAQCFGAVDAKVSSYKLYTEGARKVYAYSGPTPQQPQFIMKKANPNCFPFYGMPQVWNFTWQEYTPERH